MGTVLSPCPNSSRRTGSHWSKRPSVNSFSGQEWFHPPRRQEVAGFQGSDERLAQVQVAGVPQGSGASEASDDDLGGDNVAIPLHEPTSLDEAVASVRGWPRHAREIVPGGRADQPAGGQQAAGQPGREPVGRSNVRPPHSWRRLPRESRKAPV